jgi:hypothetical protein
MYVVVQALFDDEKGAWLFAIIGHVSHKMRWDAGGEIQPSRFQVSGIMGYD